MKQMAGAHDEQIATTLNRLGFKTGAGHTWNDKRVTRRDTHTICLRTILSRHKATDFRTGCAISRRKCKQCTSHDQVEEVARRTSRSLCTLEDFDCGFGFRGDQAGGSGY